MLLASALVRQNHLHRLVVVLLVVVVLGVVLLVVVPWKPKLQQEVSCLVVGHDSLGQAALGTMVFLLVSPDSAPLVETRPLDRNRQRPVRRRVMLQPRRPCRRLGVAPESLGGPVPS